MNIKEAKQEVKDTVRAYLEKDDTGAYEIPVEKQRPILLIGAPGIGKTAIMEQAAAELGINLVAYTITHHTRQSAIGLPFISQRVYGGQEYSVTEYTMSEIIASVYEQIEKSGVKEGILFLDEINCVSETLAPTMLQFLQYKTFGTHKIPEGFVIVTAGNPPQYNKSVRDFDIVTLDRVKKITIEEDLPVWKEYAYQMGVHGAIMAYLEIRKENFYSIRADIEDKYFVTARGWEDLSRVIQVYEKTGMAVTENLVGQYLQDPEIAQDFATYYELYNKYKTVYRIPDIMNGTYPDNVESIKNSPFDEKLSLISLLIDTLNQEFRTYAERLAVQQSLFKILTTLRSDLQSGRGEALPLMHEMRLKRAEALEAHIEAKMIDREGIRTERLVLNAMQEMEKKLTVDGTGGAKSDFGLAKSLFDSHEADRQKQIQTSGDHLTHAFEFMSRTFGEGQEMVIFLSELAAGYYSLKYVSECGNEAYDRYNKLLLLKDRQDDLRNEVIALSEL